MDNRPRREFQDAVRGVDRVRHPGKGQGTADGNLQAAVAKGREVFIHLPQP